MLYQSRNVICILIIFFSFGSAFASLRYSDVVPEKQFRTSAYLFASRLASGIVFAENEVLKDSSVY